MDRTHWKLGRTENLLCVGLVYQRVSIPLAYQSLGNSHTDERKQESYLDVCCLSQTAGRRGILTGY